MKIFVITQVFLFFGILTSIQAQNSNNSIGVQVSSIAFEVPEKGITSYQTYSSPFTNSFSSSRHPINWARVGLKVLGITLISYGSAYILFGLLSEVYFQSSAKWVILGGLGGAILGVWVLVQSNKVQRNAQYGYRNLPSQSSKFYITSVQNGIGVGLRF